MLEVKNLRTVFKNQDQDIVAVNDVSFTIPDNQMVGLVGESGSGKSITALSIINLLPPNGYITNGEINWNGQDLLSLTESEKRYIRGREIGLIFQNPLAALNPVFTIGNQMVETIKLHHGVATAEAKDLAIDFLKKVKIPDPHIRINHYPHQFSIGMCQRIMIALTLSMNPTLLIADEPTASLDVTIQAEILDLLNELRNEYKLSILFISHDLSVVAQHCDHILVMYLGNLVEEGNPDQIFKSPQDPYTQKLISSIPIPPQ